jgi:hypothetical protein
MSVAPLLAWVFGLGSFRSWFLATTLPGTATLVWLAAGPHPPAGARRIITVGLFAGVVGTLGYDLFRIPFVFGFGYRLLSPIESYGVLLTGSTTSSGWTDLAGWAWHVSNGAGFAIAYVAVAQGRRWPWGVAWAMVLESATVLTPFATYYDLAGKADVILIAYAAHIPFGLAVGWSGQHAAGIDAGLRRMTPAPNAVLLGALTLVLVMWLAPTRPHRLPATPAGAAAAIEDGRLHPEFVRVDTGGAVTLANLDDRSYEIAHADDPDRIEAGSSRRFVFSEPGVHRLPIDGRPFRGGFVIVDDTDAAHGQEDG